MEEDTTKHKESINLIWNEFENTKLEMCYRMAKFKKMFTYLREEERATLKTRDLLLIYQGEWKKQVKATCDIHPNQPLSLFCFTDCLALCPACLVEKHLNHSVCWVDDQRQVE